MVLQGGEDSFIKGEELVGQLISRCSLGKGGSSHKGGEGFRIREEFSFRGEGYRELFGLDSRNM